MSQTIEPRIWAAFGIIAMAHTATASPLTGRLGGRADLQSTARQGKDARVRGRPLRRMRQLHAGPERDLHEVQYLRGDEWV